MSKEVKVWNGSPKDNGICRLVDEEECINSDDEECKKCIDASSEEFKNYGAMTWEDIGVIQEYIETLIFQCKKWKE